MVGGDLFLIFYRDALRCHEQDRGGLVKIRSENMAVKPLRRGVIRRKKKARRTRKPKRQLVVRSRLTEQQESRLKARRRRDSLDQSTRWSKT